jgi:hypothetical protein
MTLFKHIFVLIGCCLLFACSAATRTITIKSYAPLKYDEPVLIVIKSEYLPKDADYIGEVKVGDSGFSVSCSLEHVLDKAKIEARKNGGNLILITKHKPPDLWSTCHRIAGKIYKADDVSGVKNYELKNS